MDGAVFLIYIVADYIFCLHQCTKRDRIKTDSIRLSKPKGSWPNFWMVKGKVYRLNKKFSIFRGHAGKENRWWTMTGAETHSLRLHWSIETKGISAGCRGIITAKLFNWKAWGLWLNWNVWAYHQLVCFLIPEYLNGQINGPLYFSKRFKLKWLSSISASVL